MTSTMMRTERLLMKRPVVEPTPEALARAAARGRSDVESWRGPIEEITVEPAEPLLPHTGAVPGSLVDRALIGRAQNLRGAYGRQVPSC